MVVLHKVHALYDGEEWATYCSRFQDWFKSCIPTPVTILYPIMKVNKDFKYSHCVCLHISSDFLCSRVNRPGYSSHPQLRLEPWTSSRIKASTLPPSYISTLGILVLNTVYRVPVEVWKHSQRIYNVDSAKMPFTLSTSLVKAIVGKNNLWTPPHDQANDTKLY